MTVVVRQDGPEVLQGEPSNTSAGVNPVRYGFVNPYRTTHDTSIRFDASYIKTVPGSLKIGQAILDLVCFICITISLSQYDATASWIKFISMTGFIVTEILFLCYLLHFPDRFNGFPWIKFDFGVCTVWVIFYFIASILAVLHLGTDVAFIAAGLFGFCAMVAYSSDAFFKYQVLQTGQLAQGDTMINKQTTTSVTSPSTYP